MNKNIKILIALIIILVIGFIIWKSNGKPVTTSSEIVIGSPLSLSGSAATDGEDIKKGADLAIEDLKKNGVNVRMAYEDDSTDPGKTVSAVQKLYATENHIDAFIGLTWGFLVDAASKITIQKGTMVYSPANTSEIVTTRSPLIFYGTLKNKEQGVPITQWLQSIGSKKVGIIVDNTAWGDSHMEAFTSGIKNAGATLVGTEKLPVGGEKDGMVAAFTKVIAGGADTILWTGYDNAAGAILMQRIQQQPKTVNLLAATAIPVSLIKNKTVTVGAKDSFYYLRPESSTTFGEKYKTRYGSYPGSYAESAYDGVMLIVDGIKKKSPNQTLSEYLHSGVTYKGYQIDYKFDGNGDIQGGKWLVEKL